MTEIAKIYEQIAKLRETKSLEEIKLHLIASNYDKDSVEHAIKYVHRKEMDDEFLLRDILENGIFYENFKIIGFRFLAIIGAIAAISFGIDFIRVLAAPYDKVVYSLFGFILDNNSILVVLPLIFSVFGIVEFLVLIAYIKKRVSRKNELLEKLENMKKRNAIDAKHKSK
jgi:hypothetical protein